MSSNELPIRQFYGVEYIDLATHLRNIDDVTSALVYAMEAAGPNILPAVAGNICYDMLLKFAPEKLNAFESDPLREIPHVLPPKPLEVRIIKIGDVGDLKVDHWPSWFREAVLDEKVRWISKMPIDGDERFLEVKSQSGWMACTEGDIIVSNALGWMEVRDVPQQKVAANLRVVQLISVGQNLKSIVTDHMPAWFEQCLNTGLVFVYSPDEKRPDFTCLRVKGVKDYILCEPGQAITIDDAGYLTVSGAA